MIMPPKSTSISPAKKRKGMNESPPGGMHGVGGYGSYYGQPYGTSVGPPPPQAYGYPQHQQQHYPHDPYGGHPVPYGSYPPPQPQSGYHAPPDASSHNIPNNNGWGNPTSADSYNGGPRTNTSNNPTPSSSKQTPSQRPPANASPTPSSKSGPPPPSSSSSSGWHPGHWQGGVPPYGHGPPQLPPPTAHMWNTRSSPNPMEGGWNGHSPPPPNGLRGSPRGSPVNGGTPGHPPPVCMPLGTNNSDMLSLLPKKKRDSVKDDKGRGSYRCGKCGVPKKGHICPYQPKFKRRPDEPAPETKNASTQVEMDEFLVLRRLNLEMQGFPESYIAEPKDNVGTETVYSAVPPPPHHPANGPPPPPGMGIVAVGSMDLMPPQMHSTGVGPGPSVLSHSGVNLSFTEGQYMDDRKLNTRDTNDSRRNGGNDMNASRGRESSPKRN